MSRDLESTFIAELSATNIRPILLYEGVFSTQTVRLWNGYGSLIWNSQTWLGNGWLHNVEGLQETEETRSTGITITLTAIPAEVISLILGETKQRASGKVWFGFLNSSDAVIDHPFLAFHGELDVPTIDEGMEDAVVTITYESVLVDIERAREHRYTNENQQIFYSGDKGFEYVEGLQKWSGFWGKPETRRTETRRDRRI